MQTVREAVIYLCSWRNVTKAVWISLAFRSSSQSVGSLLSLFFLAALYLVARHHPSHLTSIPSIHHIKKNERSTRYDVILGRAACRRSGIAIDWNVWVSESYVNVNYYSNSIHSLASTVVIKLSLKNNASVEDQNCFVLNMLTATHRCCTVITRPVQVHSDKCSYVIGTSSSIKQEMSWQNRV
jgi:hypothetical protein